MSRHRMTIMISLLNKQIIGLSKPEYEGDPVKLILEDDGQQTVLGHGEDAIIAMRYALEVLEKHV